MKDKTFQASLIVVLACVALVGSTGCVNREAQKQAKQTEEILTNPARPVEVLDVQTRTLRETMDITGQIVADEDTTVGAKQAGRLVAVFVKDGDPVSAGQVVAQQETSTQAIQLQQAMAQLSAARSQLAQAITNRRVAPERSSAAVKSAEAGLRQARAQLQKLRVGARSEERAQLQSAVNAAKSNMDTAKKDLDRKRELFDQGVIARQALEASENAFEGAMAQYETAVQNLNMVERGARREDIVAAEQAVAIAEEQLRSARAAQRLDAITDEQVDGARANVRAAEAQVRLWQQQISDATLRSPISGQVSGRPAQVGAVLGPGTPVVRLVGKEGLYFEGQVPESDVDKAKLGTELVISLDAVPGRTFRGTLVAINPQGSDVGRLFNARVQITDPGALLKPGMFARGTIVIRRVVDAPVVPSGALVERGGEQFVMIADGNKAKRVRVKPGLREGDWIQIDEVSAGQKVIVEGQDGLEDGVPIAINETPATSSEKQ